MAARATKSGSRSAQAVQEGVRALGRYDESLLLSRQAHTALNELGMQCSECENHLQIGMTYAASGRPGEACRAYEQARSMAVRLGEQHLHARALLGIGRCLRHTQPDEAAQQIRAALAIFEELNLPEAAQARDELTTLPSI